MRNLYPPVAGSKRAYPARCVCMRRMREAGVRQQHFIGFIDDAQECIGHRLLRATGNDDACSREIQPRVLGRDQVAKRGRPGCDVYPFCSSTAMRAASSRMNWGVGRSGSPRPKLIESGNARSKNCRISVGWRPCIRLGNANCSGCRTGIIGRQFRQERRARSLHESHRPQH